jgi:hypothetical protein
MKLNLRCTPLIQRWIPQSLGSFGTNYIIFRNAEIIFGNYFFLKENMFVKENEESFEIFKEYSIFNSKIPNDNNLWGSGIWMIWVFGILMFSSRSQCVLTMFPTCSSKMFPMTPSFISQPLPKVELSLVMLFYKYLECKFLFYNL